MAPILKFGDKYLFTAQIECVVWISADTVEIRTRSDRHLFTGTAATALRTYLNSLSQNLG